MGHLAHLASRFIYSFITWRFNIILNLCPRVKLLEVLDQQIFKNILKCFHYFSHWENRTNVNFIYKGMYLICASAKFGCGEDLMLKNVKGYDQNFDTCQLPPPSNFNLQGIKIVIKVSFEGENLPGFPKNISWVVVGFDSTWKDVYIKILKDRYITYH